MSSAPHHPGQNPQDGGRHGQPYPGDPAGPYGQPYPGDPAGPYGQPGYGQPAAPVAPQGTNGMAIAGLILAFVVAPVGFVLSIIGLSQARKRHQGGRGLAIAGIVLSLLFMVIGGALAATVFNKAGKELANTSISTIGDPGCKSGKDVLLAINQSAAAGDPQAARAELKKAMDGLNAAATKAKNAKVRDAMTALADDYDQILKAAAAGQAPPAGLEDKLSKDANRIDELCTIGGTGK